MSVDLVEAIDFGTTVVVLAILLLGIYRAAEIRRAFVNAVYRSRATWSILLMVVIIVVFITNFIPFPSTGLLSLVAGLPFTALVAVFIAYADRSILVAIQTDFFHRSTLAWPKARWPVAIAVIGIIMTLFIGGIVLTPAEQSSASGVLLDNLCFLFIAAILGYAAAALVVGARRSADRTLRRSIILLGLALFTLVFSAVVTTGLTVGSLPFAIVNQGTGVIGVYLIYRSVMSLSLVGRVEKDVSAAPGNVVPVESDQAGPGDHPPLALRFEGDPTKAGAVWVRA